MISTRAFSRMQRSARSALLGAVCTLSGAARLSAQVPVTIRAGTVIDGRGGVQRNALVVLNGGRIARIQPAGEGKVVNLTGEQPFVPAAPAESPVASFCYQARHNLQPGTYKLAVVVEDKVVPGQMGTVVKTIEVPDFRNKELNMSSVALLGGFKKLDPSQDPDEKARAGPSRSSAFLRQWLRATAARTAIERKSVPRVAF